MEFAFIIDPPEWLKAYKDTSISMMRALQARGHAIYLAEPKDLFWRAGVTEARVRHIEVRADDHDWYRAGEPAIRPLAVPFVCCACAATGAITRAATTIIRAIRIRSSYS